MDYIVTDREGIESPLVIRSAYVVISIHDPDKQRAKVRRQAGLRDVLYLAFHDAEPTTSMTLPPEIRMVTSEHADEIWKFVERHRRDVGAVVVHCEQGMSRSPAVAAALCEATGGDARRFWTEYQPNQYVYDCVLEAAGGTG